MMRIKATTLTVRGEHGEEFELNPATMTEVYVKDKDGKIKAKLDMALLLNPDTPERDPKRAIECFSLRSVPHEYSHRS